MRCVLFSWFQCYTTRKNQPQQISNHPQQFSSDFGFQFHTFSYEELLIATKHFASSGILGKGSFGIVYHDCSQILSKLSHQNLVPFYGYCHRHDHELMLVFEFVSNGTLADHLHGKRKKQGTLVPWHTRLNIAIEAASALAYLHNSGIIHRDIKSSKILLDDNLCVKVADFGLSRMLPLVVSTSKEAATFASHASTAPQGTNGYIDPDYFQFHRVCDKSDTYSFGVVLAEIISSLPAVDDTWNPYEVPLLSHLAMNKIQNEALHELVDPCLGFQPDNEIGESITAVAELAFQCLQCPKELRPSMKQVLETLQGKLRDGCEIVIERVSSNDKRQIFQQFLNEILVSNILDHKNLVTFRGYAFHHEEFLVAHEYLSNGTLAAYLECEIQHNKCTLPLLTRMEIAIDIANALSYLHKNGIIHHNINSSNILLDKNMCAKVAGLHLSRKLPEDVSVNATSIVSISSDIAKNCVYIDPEYVSHGRVSTKNDVYSFGVVLCDLISSKLAKYWESRDGESIAVLLGRNIENQALDKVLDPRTGFQSDHKIMQVMTAMAELALNCMGFPQEQRPNMEQVLDILNGKRLERYKTIEAFRIFDFADLRKATMQFRPDRILGEGGFGSVFYGNMLTQ
ncbi:hypothetical protein Ahy_A05g022978 isoform B [Arachis hypogaea]|uniref:non-specific serine/threonine protein kinase n=1 Tax=Arachis hypogaea TaxID=3818 RepID=A0A445D214_ARAHY|nr:hypothetical protein Ahy_A05g022978 isoform B [Arachis hypogaea]